jgi:hypothetical protein
MTFKSGKLCWDHDEIAAQAAETFYQAGNLLPGRQPLTE